MDVTFSNMLEGTRQYFMGLPKQAQGGNASNVPSPWSSANTAPRSEELMPAPDSGQPTSSMPAQPPRPPSEPIEPEPHIIHKATVMREAAEKRREQPDPDDEEDPGNALSPPSHIIHKPPAHAPPASPAAAPQVPSPSPVRPPSAAALTLVSVPASTVTSMATSTPVVQAAQSSHPPASQHEPTYRPPTQRVQTPSTRPPDHFAPGRPPDPYSATRPPETYVRYHYESNASDVGASTRGPPVMPSQQSASTRHSPQTYAKRASSMPQHTSSRLRDAVPSQRYVLPTAQHQPPLNDRVPPIHHPHMTPIQRVPSADGRAPQYQPLSQHREPSPYSRGASSYDRHPAIPQRKYDPQQAYPGYRPLPSASQAVQSQRIEPHHHVQYKHTSVDTVSPHYAPPRPLDRAQIPSSQTYSQIPPHEIPRHPAEGHAPNARKPEYPDTRTGSYHYPTPSTSAVRYAPNPSMPVAPVPVVPSSPLANRTAAQRPGSTPKTNYEYPTTNNVPTSPARSAVKPAYPNQTRMTVSVTSLVNQMNQTKQKRESPLDLSVKTVKNSADSSTTQDDLVDSATAETTMTPVQSRPTSSSRNFSLTSGYIESHKVDFAPDFKQYRERSSSSHVYNASMQPSHHTARFNGTYDPPLRPAENYPVESRQHAYDRSESSAPSIPRIDLTRSTAEERRPDNRIRDDRNFLIEERKRPTGPIVNNIPDKMVRYETWTADSRISDRMIQSAREQHELMSRPVYSYSSHKQFEAYQNEQKRIPAPTMYRDHHAHFPHRYPVHADKSSPRERHDYHTHYSDRVPSNSNRHVIQKVPSHRDIHSHHLEPHNGVPADKRVLSILRNSLETKQTGFVEPIKPARQIPDLIVIDDVDDSVIEITDLTKDNETETTAKPLLNNNLVPNLGHHIQMPKAVDSIARDSDYQRFNNADPKSKSPENDVASRIRTKAELKVMPPSQDNSARPEVLAQNATPLSSDKIKPLPKSQKQHLFNQIRQDNLRIESVIKSDASLGPTMSEVKTEPMNIDEIEKDAEIPIKTEDVFQNLEPESANLNISDTPGFDLDWDNACDSFMEQLKSGCHKKKTSRKRIESNVDGDSENKAVIIPKVEPTDTSDDKHVYPTILPTIAAPNEGIDIIIKQEPVDAEEMTDESVIKDLEKPESIKVPETTSENNSERKSTSSGADTEPVLSKLNKTCEEADPNSTTKLSPSKSEKTIKEFKDKIKESTKIKRRSLLGKDKDRNKVKQQSDAKETDKDHIKTRKSSLTSDSLPKNTNKLRSKNDKHKNVKKQDKVSSKGKEKPQNNLKVKSEKIESTLTATSSNSQITNKTDNIKTVIKEEIDSTDDDEPLIKSKIMKEKEMKYQLLKDLSQKSAYVKLECFDVDMNKNTRISIDSITKDKDEKSNKGKPTRQSSRTKGKSSTEVNKLDSKNDDSSSGSDDDDVSVASRLRLRKPIKTEDDKDQSAAKLPGKSSPKKQDISNISNSSTPIGKPGFGDGSDFHPGWEEELYRYKRSLRMPTRLIAIPRGRSGGPFVKGSGAFFSRGSTSLPDLDPAPLSPAPSSAPSAATDDLFARRPDKLALDSDLESNSSSSAVNRLQYDSEASTSTIFSSSIKKKANSIVDVLMKKCGKKDEKKKSKDKDDKLPKVIPKSLNPSELLPTPSLGLVKKDNKGSLSAKKEKLMEDIFYLGAFRKETVTAFRNAFIKNTDGLIGATEEFAPVVLKSRTRTESRVLKQRATIKEVFGDERPASAPPACRDNNDNDNNAQNNDSPPDSEERVVKMKKEPKDNDAKPKLKPRKLVKDKLLRRSNSIRDGLRSTISLKRNDAKGRLLRLKKRNSLMKSLATKRMKHLSNNKIRKEKLDDSTEDNVNKEDKINKEEGSSENIEGNNKRRFKRLFGRRKFSSGFDYIRKKKKIRREENATTPNNRIRRPAVKPSPESVHDIHKEIKGWFINKSIGETHLHRAARLGYTDCVAYCLEKLSVDPSAKDNAGYTPLHFASAKGHVRIARLLLQYGADVSAAAQGGIRPLHEACENSNVEVIRLLLSYGADPLLGTYAGQTPEELTEGPTTRFLRLHIADVQGRALEPWRFPPPATVIDREELGCDPLSSPPPSSPPPPPDSMVEIQCTEAPLPPFYSLRPAPGQPTDGLWCLLQDVTNLLQIKSKESLLKQIHCGSGSPKELLREIRTQEFLERAQCHQLLGAGEKVNVRASKVALVRVTDKLRQLLKIETVLVS